jgi:hypothetical protein
MADKSGAMQPDPHGFLALLFRLSMHFDVGG